MTSYDYDILAASEVYDITGIDYLKHMISYYDRQYHKYMISSYTSMISYSAAARVQMGRCHSTGPAPAGLRRTRGRSPCGPDTPLRPEVRKTLLDAASQHGPAGPGHWRAGRPSRCLRARASESRLSYCGTTAMAAGGLPGPRRRAETVRASESEAAG
jgi:hypothetical protein